jgi:hypothetical protein
MQKWATTEFSETNAFAKSARRSATIINLEDYVRMN